MKLVRKLARMKKKLTALVMAFTLLVTSGGVSLAQDMQRGIEAYNKGDYATALREWKPLAEQGHAKAQHNLGLMYLEGQGVNPDYKRAYELFLSSAEQGNAKSQHALGSMYEPDEWNMVFAPGGVLRVNLTPTELSEAVRQAAKWYRKAAKQGHADALFQLGQMQTEYSDDFKLDYLTARNEELKLYRKAAALGHAEAQYRLGLAYHVGFGVEKNYDEAGKWYGKAAKQGYRIAASSLDEFYENGESSLRGGHYEVAFNWLRPPAEQGHARARKLIGVLHQTIRIKSKTSEEMAKLEKLVREWLSKHPQ